MQATLTKTPHTAGPWEVRKISERLYGVDDKTGTAVADLHAIQGRHTPANARLIAAAPDLFEALKRSHQYLLLAVQEDDARLRKIAEDDLKMVQAALLKAGAVQ